MLKVQNLEFTYPKSNKKAVNDVSFQIKKEEMFGFLGPNGAGKITTQKVIIRFLRGYRGNATFYLLIKNYFLVLRIVENTKDILRFILVYFITIIKGIRIQCYETGEE